MNLGKYEIEDQITAAKWFETNLILIRAELECSGGALEVI